MDIEYLLNSQVRGGRVFCREEFAGAAVKNRTRSIKIDLCEIDTLCDLC